jgi:hypothetical protein
MSKITLTPVSNPQNLTSLQNTINNNNTVIQTAWDNTLSRDGTVPNTMLSNLDMNSNQILNLPSPASMSSPARLQDVVSNPSVTVPALGTSGATVGLLNTGWTQSGNNTWTGTNNFTNTTTFSSITLPANSVNSSNVVDGSLTGTDLAAGTVANSNLAPAAASTIKGNAAGSSTSPQDLTLSQFYALTGVLTGSQTIKTTNYTVVAADAGTTFILGGGAYNSLTFNSAGSYPGNFAVSVVNQDSRGKAITLTGATSFILWPGQTTVIGVGSGAWYYENPGRWRKQGIQLFVDVANGSDVNDGLTSGTGAFRSIGAAYQALNTQMDCMNSAPTINIANGTYGETVTMSGQLTGYNVVFLIGQSPSGVVWRPLSGYCLLVGDNAECEIQNIKFDNVGGPSGNFAVALHQTGVLDILSGCEFGNFGGGTHMSLDHGGCSLNLPASYTVSGSATNHLVVGGCGSVTTTGGGTVTISGSPTIGVWYQATGSGANIGMAPGTTFSGAPAAGCQKYNVTLNASLSLSGNTLPGSVAGVTATGGQAA